LATCKKEHSTWAGEYYVRIPMMESNQSYFFCNVFNGSLDYVFDQPDRKTLWKFIPAGEDQYNLAIADHADLVLTDFEGTTRNGMAISAKDSSLANHQLFRIVKNLTAQDVSIQSMYSGKFIQFELCFKNSQPWAASSILTDTTHCNANDFRGNPPADTCYCVSRYLLERK
jgi:hypothetical protein